MYVLLMNDGSKNINKNRLSVSASALETYLKQKVLRGNKPIEGIDIEVGFVLVLLSAIT